MAYKLIFSFKDYLTIVKLVYYAEILPAFIIS